MYLSSPKSPDGNICQILDCVQQLVSNCVHLQHGAEQVACSRFLEHFAEKIFSLSLETTLKRALRVKQSQNNEFKEAKTPAELMEAAALMIILQDH